MKLNSQNRREEYGRLKRITVNNACVYGSQFSTESGSLSHYTHVGSIQWQLAKIKACMYAMLCCCCGFLAKKEKNLQACESCMVMYKWEFLSDPDFLIPMMLRFIFFPWKGKMCLFVCFFLWEKEKSFLSFDDDVHALLLAFFLSRVVYFFLSQSVLLCATVVSQAEFQIADA